MIYLMTNQDIDIQLKKTSYLKDRNELYECEKTDIPAGGGEGK
jgi:hypothetical protein